MLSTMRQLSVEKQRQNISEMETEASANHHLHHHHHLHSGQAIIIVILVIFMKEFALKVFIVFIYCERESRTAKMETQIHTSISSHPSIYPHSYKVDLMEISVLATL